MRRLLFGVLAIGAIWLLYARANQPAPDLPPAFTAFVDKIKRDVDEEMAGPRGAEARAICMRVAGVTFPAQTSTELIRAGYSADTAIKYVDCIVNYLHPVLADKRPGYQ
ncbi:hypothetical protein [Bradyrhizobium sp. BR 1433]|uniref:hypothetical protein n=1 Tax=Bradyrhizobium sp. BR 1433 TaxID=3447967 RepID=UPI003EE7F470